jgi:hypothetical protein
LEQVLKVEGSRSRRVGEVTFYRCPECGDCQEVLLPNQDNIAECFTCDKSNPASAFAAVKKKRVIAQCAGCGDDVAFTSSYIGIIGPLCPKFECANYVAVCYGNSFFEPKIVLDPSWNRGLCARTEPLAPGLLFARCTSKKDYTVLRVLQVLAKQDDSRFNFASPEEHHAAIYLDSKRQKYIGFVIWTESETAVMRQLFVVRDERRNGYASKLFTFWAQHYAKRLNADFGIEGPNEASTNLLLKLGHVRIEGSDLVGVDCHFAPVF